MEKTLTNLKKGIVAPCYLLYGEEEYLIKEALNKMIAVLVPEADQDFSLFYLDGENTDINSLMDHLLTPSLLGDTKVIVVQDTTIFTSRDDLAKLAAKIRTTINENPTKAARYFLTFLNIAGFSLEDLYGTGWQKITDEQWSGLVKGDAGDEREKWLPRILDICQTAGLTDASTSKTEKLEEVLKAGLPAGNCLIFTAEAVDKRKSLYKIVANIGVVNYFSPVKKEYARKEILQKEAQKLLDGCGKKMAPAAWIALGKKTGFDFRNSLSELEKLISFVGERALIDKEDVEEAVGRTREEEIFALTNALSEKNQLAAISTLNHLLDQGIHQLMIMTMLSREIRLLLQARVMVDSGKLPKFNQSMEYGWFQNTVYPVFSALNPTGRKNDILILNQHPFSVFNALRNCVRFTTSRLTDLLDELLSLERSMKTSASNPQLLLENFLIKFCA